MFHFQLPQFVLRCPIFRDKNCRRAILSLSQLIFFFIGLQREVGRLINDHAKAQVTRSGLIYGLQMRLFCFYLFKNKAKRWPCCKCSSVMAPNEANRKTQFMETALRIMDPCHAMGKMKYIVPMRYKSHSTYVSTTHFYQICPFVISRQFRNNNNNKVSFHCFFKTTPCIPNDECLLFH